MNALRIVIMRYLKYNIYNTSSFKTVRVSVLLLFKMDDKIHTNIYIAVITMYNSAGQNSTNVKHIEIRHND